MATLEQLSAALVKADAAGNAADAKALADAIRQMQTASSTATAQPKERGFLETLGAPIEAVSQGIISGGGNVMFGAQRLLGKGLEAVGARDTGTFLQQDAAQRLAQSQAAVAPFKQEFPVYTGAGELGAEIAGTFPVGGIIAAPLKAIPAAAPLAQSLRTGGFSTGRSMQGASAASKVTDAATRAAGGATLGGVTSEIIDPENTTLGAVVGGAVPFAGPALGKVGGAVANFSKSSELRAAKLAQQALGKDLPDVVNALRNAQPGVSVAQATSKFQNPALQALVKDSLESTPEGAQYLNKLATMTDEEAVNELAKLAGGKTATDVRATSDIAKSNLNAITTPMRDTALNRANLGKEVARLESMSADLGEQAAAQVREVRRLIDLGDHAAAAARFQTIEAGLPASSRFAPAKSQGGFSDQWAATFTYPGKLAQMSDEWASKAADASLDLGQGARFAQSAADAMRSVGIKPLEGAPLADKIAAIAQNKAFAENDLIEGAATRVADGIRKWTDGGGVIDAQALEAIRKNAVNAAIAKLRPGADATSQRNAAASVMSQIKPLIDDAIEQAGGKGWRDYLAFHSKGMQNIAEKKLKGEALRLWKTDKDGFVRLVQNETPENVEKILGPGKYNIAIELAGDTMNVLQKQASDHLLREAASKQATEGQKALASLIAQNTSSIRFPSFLTFWASAGNRVIGELEKRLGAKTTKILSDAMQDPQAAANLIETLPPAEKNKIVQFLNNPSKLSPQAGATTTRTVVNALAPKSENQNALAP
jgi:hypothetical protein